MSNLHKGHRERVKKEFLNNGLEHFPDHKKLELLLYFSIKQQDTNRIGHKLMERFGSLSGVLDAPIDLLMQVEGIGLESATLIKLTACFAREYFEDFSAQNNVISDCETAKEYMRYKFLCQQTECIYLACLSNNGKVIFCGRIAEGSPEKVNISPSLVVRTALKANAVRAVLAHNHPGGICLPSTKDLRTTSILHEELKRVDVELIDHIIVAPDGVYSMVENNMFPASRTQ